jgi:hypothetical protein
MNGPKHLSCDKDDSVLIADTETHTIRRYSPKDGKIHRVAGTGKKGAGGVGGAPDQQELSRPARGDDRFDGAVVICDSDNNRILRIEK